MKEITEDMLVEFMELRKFNSMQSMDAQHSDRPLEDELSEKELTLVAAAKSDESFKHIIDRLKLCK